MKNEKSDPRKNYEGILELISVSLTDWERAKLVTMLLSKSIVKLRRECTEVTTAWIHEVIIIAFGKPYRNVTVIRIDGRWTTSTRWRRTLLTDQNVHRSIHKKNSL